MNISEAIQASQDQQEADMTRVALALLGDEQYGRAFQRATLTIRTLTRRADELANDIEAKGKDPSRSSKLQSEYGAIYNANSVLEPFIHVWLDTHPEYKIGKYSAKSHVLPIINRMVKAHPLT